MTDLNRDILYLIFQRFQNDKKTLLLCLLVNKTWCEVIIPILWKNPWKYLKKKKKLLLNVIVSHLSNESKNDLMSQGIDFLINCYQRPLFDYISFYREFTHLYIPYQFDHQIHLIPGAEHCFSKLVFLSCNTNINDNVLSGLIELCKSIKELELIIEVQYNNHGIVRLIESSKKLFNIRLLPNNQYVSDSFCKILEDSLVKHSNTIEYFKITKQPITKILSSFINLKILELDCYYYYTWNCLINLSLPFLQILRAKRVPIKALASLIENTSGHLVEINVECINPDEFDNKRIIQAIYQHCPNLKYLKMLFKNSGTLELEKLLINCKYLEGLFILAHDNLFDWNKLFEILTRSSPTSLFKFKLNFYNNQINFESLKLFFDNWKGKRPMLLQTISSNSFVTNYFKLKEMYKEEKVIEKYVHFTWCGRSFEDFEWS
ncbi:hypothetical protein GLOIN_2v1785437 [Rhizophagus clarus]|uniref:F-box domain-containing protein n=1 Tax=Rhizophagus clarus TaxID=94130 RepID=A0A8H3KXC7_9GLOM|nr:hypothetical protein GLOIN_2v1785437 [Rhizophagus clarus]